MTPWDSEELTVESDSALVARYRRLQSWYRETHLGVGPGPSGSRTVGSSVPKGLHPGLNFLTASAWQHAEERIREVRAEHGTLDEDRLRRNLLSSMPMCFNIFGSLRGTEGFRDLLAATADPSVAEVAEVICEWAPPKEEHLNDRSAFDAVVRYATASGKARFLGIETKYTEPFSQHHYENETYEAVTTSCGWFAPGAFEALENSSAKQLWRTAMLAASYEEACGAKGRVAVVSLAEDVRATSAVALLQSQMTDPSRVAHIPLEVLVAEAGKNPDPTVREWADRFADRYLDPGRLQ